MKTQEQIERALKKYEEMLKENKRKFDYEDDWIKVFYESKDMKEISDHWFDPEWANKKKELLYCHIETLSNYFKAEKNVYACEKLIKNCKWILDIE